VSPFDEIFNFQREVDRLFTQFWSDVRTTRDEQTLTLPPFLEVDKLSASHRHGMLQLTVPRRESAKRRR
jgi:HSP20 family molecular chaperone IbpA